jgi:hypothetical protein
MLFVKKLGVEKFLIVVDDITHEMFLVENIHIVLSFSLMSIMNMLIMTFRNLGSKIIKSELIKKNMIWVLHSISCCDHPNALL